MNKNKFTGKHILLLILYSPGKTDKINEGLIGRTRIIKMMFLFSKEIKKNFTKDSKVEIVSFPEFYAWDYGPFSKDVYNDIEFFINNDFVNSKYIDEQLLDFEFQEYEKWIDDFSFDYEKELLLSNPCNECFSLTDKGAKFVEKNIYSNLSNNQKEIIKYFKKTITTTSINGILRYTYLKYPEYSIKSKVKERIIG